MKRKVLVIAVALMAAAMLVTPLVSAKPSTEKNNSNFLSFVWHQEGGNSAPVEGYPKVNPPWAVYPGPDVKVTHTQAVWYLNPMGNNYVQIGENAPITIDASTGYEGYMYVEATYLSPTSVQLNYRVYERIMWDDNYVEIMCNERASLDLSGPFPAFSGGGTFVGHGEIDGQMVQLTGIREGVLQLPAPGIILDTTGTIRFLGNAP